VEAMLDEQLGPRLPKKGKAPYGPAPRKAKKKAKQEPAQQPFFYEPGEPWTMTYAEREALIQRKMVELRAKRWEEEIEQEARRRIAIEDRERKRLQDEQEIAEIEALLEEQEAEWIRKRDTGVVPNHR
jgi:hypothetical protein